MKTLAQLFDEHKVYDKRLKNGAVKVFLISDASCTRTYTVGMRGLKNMVVKGLIFGFEQSAKRYKLLNDTVTVY